MSRVVIIIFWSLLITVFVHADTVGSLEVYKASDCHAFVAELCDPGFQDASHKFLPPQNTERIQENEEKEHEFHPIFCSGDDIGFARLTAFHVSYYNDTIQIAFEALKQSKMHRTERSKFSLHHQWKFDCAKC